MIGCNGKQLHGLGSIGTICPNLYLILFYSLLLDVVWRLGWRCRSKSVAVRQMQESRQGLWWLERVEAEVKVNLPEIFWEGRNDTAGQCVRCGY